MEYLQADWEFTRRLEPVADASHRARLREPDFVARERELLVLETYAAKAASGIGSMVQVVGASGSGKSKLLDEIARRATARGAWVLRGQGVVRSAHRPFPIFDGVLRDLIPALRSDVALGRMLGDKLGCLAPAVCAALPALTGLPGFDGKQSPTRANLPATSEGAAVALDQLGKEAHGESRTLAALTSLLGALGTPERPVVFLFDDCQWADDLTVRLIAQWRRSCDDEMPRHGLIVCAFRKDETASSAALAQQNTHRTLSLSPFALGEVRRLIESVANVPVDDEVVDAVLRMSDGVPFMATALIHGLIETGAIVSGRNGWRLDHAALCDARSPRRAAAILSCRVSLLRPATKQLLSVGAVLGKQFEAALAISLSGQTAGEAEVAFDEATRRQIVRIDEGGATCTFAHDNLREALLAETTDAERRAWHRAAAEHLASAHPDRVFELAHHFDEAGDSAHAFPHARKAAQEARAQYALEVAEHQYAIAERALGATDPDVACEVLEAFGDVLMLRGKYTQAAEKFDLVRRRSKDDLVLLRIAAKFGELEFKRGDVAAASEELEKGLAVLGKAVPRTTVAVTSRLALEAAKQSVRSLFPGRFAKHEATERDRLDIRLHSRLAYAYYFRSSLDVMWPHFYEINAAERHPPTPELAQAYSNHCVAMSIVAWNARAIRYGERGLAIRRELGDLWGIGQSLGFLSIAHYHASNYEQTLVRAREAIRALERAGDRWEAHLGMYMVGLALCRLGRMAEAASIARQLHASATEIGDFQASCISLVIWATATHGAIPENAANDALERVGKDKQSTANLLHADGLRLFYAGRLCEAEQRFERAFDLIAEAKLRNAFIAPIPAWLATVRRTFAERTDPAHNETRRAWLRKANRAARAAWIWAQVYGNNLPHAHRELGVLCALEGKTRQARFHLKRSVAIAEEHGAEQERLDSLAQSRRFEAL